MQPFPCRTSSAAKGDKWWRPCDFRVIQMPFGIHTAAETHESDEQVQLLT